jgi:predicted nucleic acid-binding protein
LIVYFDTSALVPLVIDEATTEAVSRLWRDADRVLSSRLIYAEARSAVAMAQRLGRLSSSKLREAVVNLDALVVNLDVVEVTDELVRRAGGLADAFGLRGYDAVHLASAELVRDPDLFVASGDRPLVDAARSLGLGIANI